MESSSPFIIHFKSLHQDAILWKAGRLWAKATDPDEQSAAMEQLVEMVCSIENETKRLGYIEAIQKASKIRNNLLKKQVKDELASREAKKQAEVAKKKIEAQFKTADEAGLQEGFEGNIYDALKYGIYEHEGVYYTRGFKGPDYPVTNFTMKILYHVNTSDEQAFRLIAIKNLYGFETFINMNTDDFVSVGSFKKVIARRGDYIFKGSEIDLSRLQEFLQQKELSTTYVNTLGWHKRGKFYAFANGIVPLIKDAELDDFLPVDEYGIIPYNSKNYFIPAHSKMYQDKDDKFVNEKKFVYTKPIPGVSFESWSLLFKKTYLDKSMPAVLYFIGSLFRDVIIKQLQRFPILFLFGPPGAGKGQLAGSLMAMFGEKQDQIMLGGASTVVGFMRKFAQLRNALVWLDEYKNNLPPKFIESFKNIYDGKGYERGKMTNDFSTESTPIDSAALMSGQDMPTIEPALFMRVILLSFEEGKFTPEQRKSFSELMDLEDKGLSFITASLLLHRENVELNFKDTYQRIFTQTIKDVSNVEIDDRMIMNISVLLTIFHLFKDIVKFPFDYKEVKSYLIANMNQQHGILAGNNDVAKFWGVIEVLFHQGLIMENRDFMLEDGYLYVRLMQVHPLYMKELRQRGDANYLAKPTLEHYLKLDKGVYIDYERKRFKDGSNNWCYKMKYEKLNIDLIKLHMHDNESTEQFELRRRNEVLRKTGKAEEQDGTEDKNSTGTGWQPMVDEPF